MSQENRTYRIRTKVGSEEEPVVHVDMTQSFDKFDILSLSLNQTNDYKLLSSDYGIIVGRVLANGGFGIPNAKVSVFIQYEDTGDIYKRILYSYNSPKSKNYDGIRYNLLPSDKDDECHQDIGTFPTKRMVLDDNTWIEIFDKYYKYTTRSNNAGDYMIYGVPVGTQTVHVDIDLSDIGILSQRPRDMVYKGYNINQFESPNKFRKDTNIDNLAQVFTQDKVLYVYPFWGDTTDNELGAAITRCDIDIDYRFESTCVFMGSVITDTGENALSKKCAGQKNQGKMSDMITGQGMIEMIRKTPDGFVEEYSIQGNELIDEDGVWCYQIPMNLDYVVTDEYGNMVLSDNPNKGIATRSRVRFRISMSDTATDGTARKRARYLVPNNPRFVEEDYPKFCETGGAVDYEFGSKTREEDFRDLFWNKVYTVKNYIPRLQKSNLPNNNNRTGIKMVNHSGANNPIPFNNLGIKFNFTYMFICSILKVFVLMVVAINTILTALALGFYGVGNLFTGAGESIRQTVSDWGIFREGGWVDKLGENLIKIGCFFKSIAVVKIGNGIVLNALCVDENGNEKTYNPGVIDGWIDVKGGCDGEAKPYANTNMAELFNCVENQLAQDNEVTSFNFDNDWLNGVLYLPLWYRRIKPKKRFFFGLIKVSAKDQWCSSDTRPTKSQNVRWHLKLYKTCAQEMNVRNKTNASPMGTIAPLSNEDSVSEAKTYPKTGIEYIKFNRKNEENCYGFECHKHNRSFIPIDRGLIVKKETMLGDEVYYYKPCEYDTEYNEELATLFATELVLLGSLDGCDSEGIPQFFKALESTTYNMPPDLLLEDYKYKDGVVEDSDNDSNIDPNSRSTENTGSDWGNLGVDQSKGDSRVNTNIYDNGGLFYGLTCFNNYTKPKSCINLSRICEFGVALDESQDILRTQMATASAMLNENTFDTLYDNLIPDGFISYDDIYDMDYRSMFATLNSNWLKTKLNFNTGLYEYDFNHLYITNFDGVLYNIQNARNVKATTEISGYHERANYSNNYKLEKSSNDYLAFRFGDYTKKNNAKIYFYEYNELSHRVGNTEVSTGKRFPRYENSFYFYFGLNEGKTAIDKFRSNYFAECSDAEGKWAQVEVSFVPNSWCGDQNGYIKVDTKLILPVSLKLTNLNSTSSDNVYISTNINSERFYVGAFNGNVVDGYKYYPLVNNNLTVFSLPNGEYVLEITDDEGNIFTETISFKGSLLNYDVDVHAFSVKNNELFEMGNYLDSNGNVMWDVLYKDVANNGRSLNPSTNLYNINNRTIHGYISVSLQKLLPGDYKVSIQPYDHNVFGYTFYKDNGTDKTVLLLSDTLLYEVASNVTADNFYDDVYYVQVGGEYTVASEYQYGTTYYKGVHFVYDPADNTVFAKFIGTEYEFREYAYTDINRWDVLSTTETFEIVNNYRGCDFIFHKDENVTRMTILSGLDDNDAGYLGYNFLSIGNRMFFGVPWGGERYKVTITEVCEETIETENSSVTIVVVPEFDFKMYINGIDYDLIKNFKTGFNLGLLKVSNVADDYIVTIPQRATFDSNNLYGWGDLPNIGKYNANGNYEILTPIDYTDMSLNVYTLKTTLNKYLDVLSDDYRYNGVKNMQIPTTTYYTSSVIGIPTTQSATQDISTPYCWANEYCIGRYAVDEYKASIASAADTITRVVEMTEYVYTLLNNLDGFEDGVTYYTLDNDGVYTPTTDTEPQSNVSYYYITGTINETYDFEINTQNSPDVSGAKFDKGLFKSIDLSQYSEVTGYEIVGGNRNAIMVFSSLVDYGNGTIECRMNGVLLRDITKADDTYYYNGIVVASIDNGTVRYYTYNNAHGYELTVYYYSYSTIHDKLVPIIQDVNDVIVKRIDKSKEVQSAFTIMADETVLEITYKSSEPPIKYSCAGSTEMESAFMTINI